MYDTLTVRECDLVTPCLGLVTSLLALYLSALVWRRRLEGMKDPASSLPLPPGGFGWPLLGETLAFINKGFKFYDERTKEYGQTFKTHMLGSPVVRISSGEQISKMVSKESSSMTVSLPESAKFAFGEGLVLASGEKHARMKKNIKQAFTPLRLADYLPSIQSYIRRHVTSWAEGASDQKLLGFQACQELGAELILNTVTGCDLTHDPARKVREAFVTCNDQLFCVPIALPGTGFYKAKKARKVIVDFLKNHLASSKSSGQQNHVTILDILMAHHRNQEENMTEEQLIDNAVTLLVAGSDTVSSALCSVLRLLGSHPQQLEAVRKELASRDLLDNSCEGDLTYELLQDLPYTRAVTKEILRILPPVGGTFRWTKKAVDMGDYQIPKDWQVVYGIKGMHEQTPAFTEKDKFIPDRWLEEGFEEKLRHEHPFGYAPFGFGSRTCPAKDLALLEMAVFVVEVARLGEWTPLNPKVKNVYCPTTRPADDLPMTFRKRE